MNRGDVVGLAQMTQSPHLRGAYFRGLSIQALRDIWDLQMMHYGFPNKELLMIMGKVLIVEDEEHVRKTVGLALKQAGYEVVEAIDGEEAIRTIQADRYAQNVSAIICDLALPKLNGNDVIAYIRAKLPSVPVIVLTGQADVKGAAMLFKQGVVDYLVKPAQAQTLLDSVRRAIDERALSG
jgi:two-component system chemotaxis response regulator CheY